MEDLIRLTGSSKSTLNAMQDPRDKRYDPTFPEKIELGPRAVAYSREKFLTWLNNRPVRPRKQGMVEASSSPISSKPTVDQEKQSLQKLPDSRRTQEPRRELVQAPDVEAAPNPAIEEGSPSGQSVQKVPLKASSRKDPRRRKGFGVSPDVENSNEPRMVQRTPICQNQQSPEGKERTNQGASPGQQVKDFPEQQSNDQPNTVDQWRRPKPRTLDVIMEENAERQEEYERAFREAVPPEGEKTYLEDIERRWDGRPGDLGKRK